MNTTHYCLNGTPSSEPAYWLKDGRGIELCKACDLCEASKLLQYRPEILRHYTQNEIDETIEPED